MDRDLDIVVFGASGFVGRLVALHLARHAPPEVTVGLAGRSTAKLAAVRAELGERAADWPILLADSLDVAALVRLASSARVVATTVGPYARNGLALLGACVTSGTHYADLTGEVLFVRDSAQTFHEPARQAGVRLVHSCGFDSVPSDLSVLTLHEAAQAPLGRTVFTMVAASGGFSGGTIDSLRVQVDKVSARPAWQSVLDDPYSLSPDRAGEPAMPGDLDRVTISRDPHTGRWTGPFVMGPFNTRIVRRSNALLNYEWGRSLVYSERMAFGRNLLSPVMATATATALGLLPRALGFGPSRILLDRVLPKPGQGPDEQARTSGFFRCETTTTTVDDQQLVATFVAPGDPGYGATSVMMGESVLELVGAPVEPGSARAGVVTPAVALGTPLADRLRAHGFTIQVSKRWAVNTG